MACIEVKSAKGTELIYKTDDEAVNSNVFRDKVETTYEEIVFDV